MILVLVRGRRVGNATLGQLVIDGKFFCHTLEDVVRPVKIPGQTAIPAGMYDVDITYSPHFKTDLPLVKDVPGFEGIRIHAGNTDADTEGCILVGEQDGGIIKNSRATLAKLLAVLPKQGAKLVIVQG